MIVDREHEAVQQLMISAVTAYLADLPVDFRVSWIERFEVEASRQRGVAERLAANTGAVVVFWFDGALADRVFFFLSRPEHSRLVYRTFDTHSVDEFTETFAIVVRALIETMLRGGDIEFGTIEVADPADETLSNESRDPAPREATEPVFDTEETGAAAPSDFRLTLEMAYSLSARGADLPLSQGFHAAFALRLVWRISAVVGYSLLNPLSRTHEGIELTLKRHPLSVGARADYYAIRRVTLGVVLAGIIDPTVIELRLPDGIAKKDTAPEVEFAITGLAQISVHIVWRICAVIALGIEVPLNRARYVVSDAAVDNPIVVETWVVRPAGLVGLSGDLF